MSVSKDWTIGLVGVQREENFPYCAEICNGSIDHSFGRPVGMVRHGTTRVVVYQYDGSKPVTSGIYRPERWDPRKRCIGVVTDNKAGDRPVDIAVV